jgi:hypothetical protein
VVQVFKGTSTRSQGGGIYVLHVRAGGSGLRTTPNTTPARLRGSCR